eukprot:TRINITY_DN8666_c0_g1_i1.p3 TRINITY_DN8666_c0_g1~~TRINITY_DN8666_c0_g1_i1.p3  ORF type:complete len:58 (-),score=32.59 TRINITY_DN8666_c0_g1_i1:2-175(-)
MEFRFSGKEGDVLRTILPKFFTCLRKFLLPLRTRSRGKKKKYRLRGRSSETAKAHRG